MKSSWVAFRECFFLLLLLFDEGTYGCVFQTVTLKLLTQEFGEKHQPLKGRLLKLSHFLVLLSANVTFITPTTLQTI